ncbi:MAG: hypothetical protein GY870_12415 [archaeon]|nr:hypothetical protein [archaeon]
MSGDSFSYTKRRISLLESKIEVLVDIVIKICEVNTNPELKPICSKYIQYATLQKQSDEIFKGKWDEMVKTHTRKMYEKIKKGKEDVQ